MEIVDIRDASSHAVGEFARHGVFGDRRKMLADALVQFVSDGLPRRLRQSSESGGFLEFVCVLGEVHAQRSLIVLFTCHRVAKNDGYAI